ncbi:acyl carrier protein [uncultured Selenomonas sp.]|uniref:acyl carrier protein n=1 Tax=uncultured Selenomonas sp. TaxID=159275 RepID=UPI0025FB5421|nr:acyl carrier protein [uncultured Selenomonas sp.]
MTNAEKYTKVFTDLFNMDAGGVKKLHYQDIKEWDSVGHMTLIACLEDAFDIEMDTDDIIDFENYEKGKEILKKYHIDVDA